MYRTNHRLKEHPSIHGCTTEADLHDVWRQRVCGQFGDHSPLEATQAPHKHWDLASIWPQLRPILFWEGDTALIKAYDDWKRADVEAKRLADEARQAKSKSTDSKKTEGSGAPTPS